MEWTVNYTSEKNYKNSTSAMGFFFSTMMQPLFKETGIIHWVVRGDGLHLLDMVTPTVSPHNIQSDFL